MIKEFLCAVEWGELDYLLIDTPPGTSDEHLALVSLLKQSKMDGAILVSWGLGHTGSIQSIQIPDLLLGNNHTKLQSLKRERAPTPNITPVGERGPPPPPINIMVLFSFPAFPYPNITPISPGNHPTRGVPG